LLVGAVLVGVLVSRYSQPEMLDFGWRIPFVVGGAFGLIGTYLRRYVQETPVFKSIQQRKDFGKEIPLKTIFRVSRRAIFYSLLVSTVTAAIVPAVYLYPPIYFRTLLKFEPILVQRAHTWAIVAMLAGSVFGGWLMDKIGGTKTFSLFAVGAIAAVFWLFISVQNGPQNLIALYSLVGFLCSITAFGYYFLVQSFPPETRFTGISLTYNLSSAVIGGLTPIILAALTQIDRLAPAYYVSAFCIIGAFAVAMLWPMRRSIR
jgi:MFS family permease